MSWFWGHILPGAAWLFMAIFHFLQSMHTVKYLNPLRTRPFWICFRSLFLMCACVLGVIGEMIGEWNNWHTQQNQHLTIWAGFFFSALIEYLHINNVLQDNFWLVIPPMGMSFNGIMLMFHTQLREYWAYMHIFSGYLTVPTVLALIYLSASRLSRHQEATKGSKSRPRISSISFRGKSMEDLNPIYTEQTIYEGILPGLVGYLICLQGIEWVEMAFRMGWYYSGDNLPEEVPHAKHAFLAQVIGDMFIACLIIAFTSIAARMLDNEKDSHGRDDFEKEVHSHNIL